MGLTVSCQFCASKEKIWSCGCVFAVNCAVSKLGHHCSEVHFCEYVYKRSLL